MLADSSGNGKRGTEADDDGSGRHVKKLRGASSLPTPSPSTPGCTSNLNGRLGKASNATAKASGNGNGNGMATPTTPRGPASSSTKSTPTSKTYTIHPPPPPGLRSGSGSASVPGTPSRASSSTPSKAAAAAAAKAAYESQFPSATIVPDVPLLYDTALQAHAAAAYHYQQAFVPLAIEIPIPHGHPEGEGDDADSHEHEHLQPIPLYRDQREEVYVPDPGAGHTALRLLVLALDLLAVGLGHHGLSDRERAAFGLEFATVGLKLAHAAAVMGQMKHPQRRLLGVEIHTGKLYEDLGTVVSKSLAVAKRSPHLLPYAHGLELASCQLAVLREKGSQALKILKQALATTPTTEPKHRYSLRLFLMGYLRDTGSHEFFKVALELQKEAQEAQHEHMVLLVLLARLRGHFNLRKWDNLGDTLEELRLAAGISATGPPPKVGADIIRDIVVIHYYQFLALHTGRIGEQKLAKAALTNVYDMMDKAINVGIWARLRCNGGVLKIRLASTVQATQYIFIQTTPVNVLYALTYLNSMVSRRNFLADKKTCRTLVHVSAMREHEMTAKIDDMWDAGFSSMQGIATSLQLRQTIMTIRVEVMMEEALAEICRGRFEYADNLLTEIVHTLRAFNLFHTHLPQIALLYAHFAHYLGRPAIAQRYYRAAKQSLVPGSELQVLVEIGLLGALGKLQNLQDNYDDGQPVNELADICRSGSNAQLHAVGNFLSSLTDAEKIMSKRKLFAAYDTARKGDLSMLYTLAFAFTTGTHVYGDREKRGKQLETGRHVTFLLGGIDRPDRVGQATLGLWYERKLEEYYRLQGMGDKQAKAKRGIAAHLVRIHEVRAYSLKRFPLTEGESEMGEKESDEEEGEEDEEEEEEEEGSISAGLHD